MLQGTLLILNQFGSYNECSVSAKMPQSVNKGKHLLGVLGWKPKGGRSHGKSRQAKSGSEVTNIAGEAVRDDRDIGVVSKGRDTPDTVLPMEKANVRRCEPAVRGGSRETISS